MDVDTQNAVGMVRLQGDTAPVDHDDKPKFGNTVVSWHTVWGGEFPEDEGDRHCDDAAAEMHRLRGLIMAQAAETEAVLEQIVHRLDPSARLGRPTAGRLLWDIRRLLPATALSQWSDTLRLVDRAVERRNHAVHSTVTIGTSWRPYAGSAGGELVPVISLMDDGEYDEQDLWRDMTLQQDATISVVGLLRSLDTLNQDSERPVPAPDA